MAGEHRQTRVLLAAQAFLTPACIATTAFDDNDSREILICDPIRILSSYDGGYTAHNVRGGYQGCLGVGWSGTSSVEYDRILESGCRLAQGGTTFAVMRDDPRADECCLAADSMALLPFMGVA